MFRRLRETGPAALVPLAWGFAGAAHLGYVSDRAALIAHAVMVVLLVAFVVLSWAEMADGVLRAWRLVILTGVPVTLAGLLGLVFELGTMPLLVSLVGWMLLPVPALWYTGTVSGAAGDRAAEVVNRVAAVCSLAGTVVYGYSLLGGGPLGVALGGIALVGVGQTVGIVDAVQRY